MRGLLGKASRRCSDSPDRKPRSRRCNPLLPRRRKELIHALNKIFGARFYFLLFITISGAKAALIVHLHLCLPRDTSHLFLGEIRMLV